MPSKGSLVKILLFLVVILGFGLRFYRVTEVPPALNWDETSIAYNAYSILKTGKDEWGQFLPVHFKAYGEYKLPAQIYASIPGIAIFGLNEFGVRITPVIYGMLTVLLLYFLAKDLFNNKYLGLLSAFFLAVSPWHIHLTRASFESSFSVFWVTLGTWFFVKGLKDRKYWLAAVPPFAVAIYTYNSARVFVPLFLLAVFTIYRRAIFTNLRLVLIAAGLFALMMIPLVNFWVSGEATARLKLVSIQDDPGFVLRINEARGRSSLTPPLPKLVHNKVTHYAWVFAGNYLAHFTPQFLFIEGASHKQHHVQGVGEMYAFQFPFVILGLIYLFQKKLAHRWLLVAWILLAFIPVSVTIDSIPNALRTLIAVVPYQILTALGLYGAYQLVFRRAWVRQIVIVGLLLVVGLSIYGYLDNYYTIYPKTYSRDWQYGYKQVATFIDQHYDDYDLIVFSRHFGEPHMFTLFFLGWDPGQFQTDPNLNRFETYDWVRVLRFDKFYFPDLGDAGTQFADIEKENRGKRVLFIGKQGDFPANLPRLLTVDFLNGARAFEVVETK